MPYLSVEEYSKRLKEARAETRSLEQKLVRERDRWKRKYLGAKKQVDELKNELSALQRKQRALGTANKKHKRGGGPKRITKSSRKSLLSDSAINLDAVDDML
jgi:hypothetical protein